MPSRRVGAGTAFDWVSSLNGFHDHGRMTQTADASSPPDAGRHGPSEQMYARLQTLAANRLLPMADVLHESGRIDAGTATLARALAGRERAELDTIAEQERRVCSALSERGLNFLVLKGAACARVLYPSPSSRPRTDLDLWIDSGELDLARRALAAIGLERAEVDWDPDIYGAEAWIDPNHDSWSVDLHWALLDHPALRRLFRFDDFWARSRTIPELAGRIPAVADLLLHAVLHYYGGGHRGKVLPAIWILDVDLAWRALAPAEQLAAADRFRAHGVAGLLGAALARAQTCFGTPLPPGLLASLQATGLREPLARLAEPPGSQLREAYEQWRAEPDWRRRWRRLQATLLPSRAHMQSRYPGWPRALLPLAYPIRALTGAWAALRPAAEPTEIARLEDSGIRPIEDVLSAPASATEGR